jgi:hypothetical protein
MKKSEFMSLIIGTDRSDGEDIEIPYPSKILNKHVAILGQTGYGKTVAAKVFVEEAVMNGIPSVVIDPSGDLAQLAIFADEGVVEEAEGDTARHSEFKEKVEVRIWTPANTSGLPLSINPFTSLATNLDEVERIASLDMMASSLTLIAGYKVQKPAGELIKAYLYQILNYAEKCSKSPKNFAQLANLVEAPHGLQKSSGLSEKQFQKTVVDLLKDSEREKLKNLLRAKLTGIKNLIFTQGTPLDFDMMIEPCEEGKVPINVIFLNTLGDEDNKQNFIVEFCRRLFEWLPSQSKKENDTHLMLFFDEVKDFIPTHPKTAASKPMLQKLFSQGRKYGLSCILATQNIAEVDYKVMGQASTRLHGKVSTPHDKKNLTKMLHSIPNAKQYIDEMVSLNPGQFLLFSPEVFNESVKPVKIRWLYTHHSPNPLNEDDIKKLTTDELRTWAEQFDSKAKRLSSPVSEQSEPDEEVEFESEESTDETMGEAADEEQFEMDLLGGLLLLRDSRDQLSVMLGLTNLITTLVLLSSTVSLTMNGLDSGIGSFVAMVTMVLTLITASVLASEVVSGGEYELLQKMRKRARPLQNLALAWVLALFYLEQAEKIQLSSTVVLGIEVAAVAMALFFILQLAHRVKLGKIEWPTGDSPLEFLKGGIGSLSKSVTSTEIHALRASSKDLLDGWRMIANLGIILTICNILGWVNFAFFDHEMWLKSLLTVTTLLLVSQLITQSRTEASE